MLSLEQLLPDDRVLNCAGCGELLLISTKARKPPASKRLGGRMMGRPYCESCVAINVTRENAAGLMEDSPWQEAAIRVMEDAA